MGKTETQESTLGISLATLHKQQCNICPLHKCWKDLKHPHMDAHGTRKPTIYILGEAPGATEDEKGLPFVGKAGNCLRFRIPEKWLPEIRWNNCVRTRPPNNRTPTPIEIECCRPSINEDIEATKPVAIFGFGNVPLYWALGEETGITNWAGRKIPIKVGNHSCWFFPMMHPSYILRDPKRQEGFKPRRQSDYGSDLEFVFALHLKRAFAEVEAGLPIPFVHTVEFAKSNIEIILGKKGDANRVVEFLQQMSNEKYVGFDYETNGRRPYATDAKILSAGISGKDRTLAFALDHSQALWTPVARKVVGEALENFLRRAKCRKIVHSLIFELEWTGRKLRPELIRSGEWEDTISQAYVLDERKRGTKDLDFLCLQYFGLHLKAISNLDRANLDDQPLPEVLLYNGLDSKYHRFLYAAQRQEIKQQGLQAVYEHQLRRVPTMVLSQLKGIPVDQNTVAELQEDFEGRLAKIEAKISELPAVKKFNRAAGVDFRPSANKDVHCLLNSLGFHPDSVDEEELKEINHPLAGLVLDWRGINKQLSTYILPFKTGAKHMHPDGLLHPMVNPGGTETWRTSSDSPNSQNVSKHEFREVRRSVKKRGLKIVSFDYAGIQARNVAMESNDKVLVDAFWNNYDIHADWMEQVLRVYPQWTEGGLKAIKDPTIKKKLRDRAKNGLVFPLFFGAQSPKVAGELEIPLRQAEKLRNRFFDKFAGIHQWHEQLRIDYYKTGYVTGHSGFRRRAPINHNQLINSPIQADEAIIVCTAMSELSEMDDPRFQANMEIHDDLTFLWREDEIDSNSDIVAKAMTKINFPWINVPIVVEMSIGDDWASVKEVAKFSSVDLWGHKRR